MGKTLLQQKTPAGGGDESINGELSQAKKHRIGVEHRRRGCSSRARTTIAITTLSGSWMLYDWIGFEAPEGVELAPLAARRPV